MKRALTERDNRIAALWAEGLTAAAIGAQLGITKNAAIGIVHRMGLPKRPSPIRRLWHLQSRKLPAPAPAPVVRVAAAAPQQIPKLAPAASRSLPQQRPAPSSAKCQRPLWPNCSSLAESKAHPLWRVFCGKPVARPGLSWCVDCFPKIFARVSLSVSDADLAA